MRYGLHSLYQNRHNDFTAIVKATHNAEPHEMLVMYSLWKLDTPVRTYIAFPSYVLQ